MKKLLTVLTLTLFATLGASNAEAAQCEVELKNGRGRLLETFLGYGYTERDACQQARMQCRRVKNGGYYRAPIQHCEKVQRYVTMSCSARLTGPRGHRTIQSFYGTATARDEWQARQDACMQAQRQCEMFRSRARDYGRAGRVGSGLTQCVVERDHYGRGRDNGRYDDDIYRPLPPRTGPGRRGGRRN